MKTNNYFTLCIANILIGVRFEESQIKWEQDLFVRAFHSFYGGFVVENPDRPSDCVITIFDERHTVVLTKTNKTFLSFYTKNKNNYSTYYHISLSQFNLIILSILQEKLKGVGFILHASASIVNGKAHVFCGPSGVGKSTIVQLIASKHATLADDSVIIRKEGDEYILYQTPLMEKNSHQFARTGEQFKLGSLCFLQQGPVTKITQAAQKQHIAQQLLSQLWMNKQTKKNIKLVFQFIKERELFYDLVFAKKRSEVLKQINRT